MDDIEKSRIDYVSRIEAQLQHLQQQLGTYRPLAEKWQPTLHGSVSADGEVRFTLTFGGKVVNATVSAGALSTMSTTDATSGVVDVLIESLVADVLREVVQPEVERIQRGIQSVNRSRM